jgi:hypothetical protein
LLFQAVIVIHSIALRLPGMPNTASAGGKARCRKHISFIFRDKLLHSALCRKVISAASDNAVQARRIMLAGSPYTPAE